MRPILQQQALPLLPPASGAAPSPVPAATSSPAAAESFSWTQFGVSILYGSLAGMAAALIVLGDAGKSTKENIMGLIAAGYSGADFLEGVIKWVPKPPGI